MVSAPSPRRRIADLERTLKHGRLRSHIPAEAAPIVLLYTPEEAERAIAAGAEIASKKEIEVAPLGITCVAGPMLEHAIAKGYKVAYEPEIDWCKVKMVRAQSGAQTRALWCDADVIVFGGGAGGTKSYTALLRNLFAALVYDSQSIIFRRTSPELTGSGSLWEDSEDLYRSIGYVSRESPVHDWRRGRGLIEFRHLQHEKDKHDHQSKQYAAVTFDEATHFTEGQFWYIAGSRVRNAPAGMQPWIMAGCNPDPDSFIKQFISWWLDEDGRFPDPDKDGVKRWFIRDADGKFTWTDDPEALPCLDDNKPRSATFIASRLEDNPILIAKDSGYKSRLNNLLPHERARLRDGDWSARAVRGDYFQRGYFRTMENTILGRRVAKQPRLERDLIKVVRCYDLAATPIDGHLVPGVERPPGFAAHGTGSNVDWTRGIKTGILSNGDLVVMDMVSCQDTPGAVDELIKATAISDGPQVLIGLPQDPGQAGVDQIEKKAKMLRPYGRVVGQTRQRDKAFYARPLAIRAYKREIWVLCAPWNNEFFNELEDFPPDGGHDDIVDAFADCGRLLDISINYGYSSVTDTRLTESEDDDRLENEVRVTVGFRREKW